MKYKRVAVSRYGGPEVLDVVEDELPEPRAGEVRLKILSAGVAWGDILKRQGFSAPKVPFTPGYDLVGLVDKRGERASSVEVGQMVAALSVFGGYAEYICLPSATMVPVPDGIDPSEAVCLVMNYVTAYQLLHRAAQVKPGERILVHGAAGGVGTALLQLGQLANLEMYGTASCGKHDLVSSLGGIPIDKEGFFERVLSLTGDGVDAVFDPIGGMHVWPSYKTLRGAGRLVLYGVHSVLADGMPRALSGYILGSILNRFPDNKAVRFYNVTRPQYSSPEWCREDLSILFVLLADKEIRPVVAEQIPLVEAARAHEMLSKAAVTGKLVLLCNPK